MLHPREFWCFIVVLGIYIILLLSCSSSWHLKVMQTNLLNIMQKQDLQWEENNVLVVLWFLIQWFHTLSVLISGFAEQPWGHSTADAWHQVPLSSDVSFHPLSACLGTDTSPQQLQTWLSHKGLTKPVHWYFLRGSVKTADFHGSFHQLVDSMAGCSELSC